MTQPATHPELDVLVRFQAAAEGDAAPAIIHVASCGECLDALVALDALAGVQRGLAPDEGFDARVLGSLAKMRAAPREPAATARVHSTASVERRDLSARFRVAPTFVFLLATGCAWLLTMLPRWSAMSSGASLVPRSSRMPEVLPVAVIVGCIAAWYSWRAARVAHSATHSFS